MSELKLRPTNRLTFDFKRRPSHGTIAHCSSSRVLLELPQKPHVVLKIELQIVDVVFELRQPFDTQTEGEAGEMFRIIVHETVDGRIDHPRAEQLNPARLLADLATRASAEYARRVDFNRRLGERKITRPQARLHFGPQKFTHEIFDRTLEIAKSDVT